MAAIHSRQMPSLSAQANRHADAMVIASVVGGDLWDKARKVGRSAAAVC